MTKTQFWLIYFEQMSDTESLSLNPQQIYPQIPKEEVSSSDNTDDPCLLECIKIETEIPSFVWSDVKVDFLDLIREASE